MNLNLPKDSLPMPMSQHCWLDRQAHDRLLRQLLSLHTACGEPRSDSLCQQMTNPPINSLWSHGAVLKVYLENT